MTSSKIVIYSALARLWGNTTGGRKPNGTLAENGSGKLSSWDDKALEYIKTLGCTHLWLIGLIEHATATAFDNIEADPQDIVKGIAGSPYAIKDYYDISPELADKVDERMKEFDALVARVHSSGLKLIIDFVPNHVARTYASDVAPSSVIDLGQDDNNTLSFDPQNNFYYIPNEALHLPFGGSAYSEYPARATGNDCFSSYPSSTDWYETVKLNYGVDYQGGRTSFSPIPSTWLRMYEILRFWAAKGVDGFRCDMAEMVPPDFWAWVLPKIKEEYPVFFLAEIYQRERYQTYISSGFDFLYDKVGVYDTLRAIVRGEASADSFDQACLSVGSNQGKMCYFLENHDEQRFASLFYAGSTESLFPALATMLLSGSNPYLHYFGGEIGERGTDSEGFSGSDGRTTIFDYWSIESVARLTSDYSGKFLTEGELSTLEQHKQLFGICAQVESLRSGDYYGLNYLQSEGYDRDRVLSYWRYVKGQEWVLVIANFSAEKKNTDLRCPIEVFEVIGLPPNRTLLQENLLNCTRSISTLTNYAPYRIILDPYGVALIRFTLTDDNTNGKNSH